MNMDPWIWAVLLLGLSAGLAVLEVFFPSAGILGFLSAASAIAAIVMGFYQGPWVGTLSVLAVITGLPTLLVIAFKYWPQTPMGRRMILMAPTSEEVLPDNPEKERLKSLIGRTGTTKTKLLLSGMVTIDGQNLDAVSESQPIEVGQTVRVIQVRSNRLVVRLVEKETAPPPVDPLQQAYDDPFDLPKA
jgi:membrane-bound serine protease (ClpP class)